MLTINLQDREIKNIKQKETFTLVFYIYQLTQFKIICRYLIKTLIN